MSWNQTFSYALAISLDKTAAFLVWHDEDCNVSTLCGFELRKNPKSISFLGRLGRILNWLKPGHCEGSIQSDVLAAKNLISMAGIKATYEEK